MKTLHTKFNLATNPHRIAHLKAVASDALKRFKFGSDMREMLTKQAEKGYVIQGKKILYVDFTTFKNRKKDLCIGQF